MKVEYAVLPVTQYIVTRRYSGDAECGCEAKGEYNDERTAYEVAYALAKQESERCGYHPGDERITFPRAPHDD